MDEQRFDRLVQALGRGLNRRGVLGILAGAAGLGVGEVVAKRHRGRRRAQAQAANKVAVCHYDADADTYVLIHISQSGWDNGHSKHTQDFLQAADGGCCLDSDCASLTDQCHVGTCVVNRRQRVGACQARPTPDAACNDGDPCTVDTTCAADGTCDGGRPKCSHAACEQCTADGSCESFCHGGETCDGHGNCVAAFQTCDSKQGVCADGAFCTDDSSPCGCNFTFVNGDPTGPRLCVSQFGYGCSDGPACQDTSECDPGHICISSCCPTGICVPACGVATAARRSATTGPTTNLP